MIIQYIDESTFLSEEIEVSDELYETAIDIRKQYMSSVLSDCSNIMLAKDKKTLVFVVNFGDPKKDRLAFERGDNAYQIYIHSLADGPLKYSKL